MKIIFEFYHIKVGINRNVSLLDPNNKIKIFSDNNLMDELFVYNSESRGGSLFLIKKVPSR